MKERLKNNSDDDLDSSIEGKNHVLYKILDAGILEVESGWRKFKIQMQERITHQGSPCHGITDFDDCTISLDPGMKSDLALEVTIHELFHILLESVGMGGDEEDLIYSIKNEQATSIISRGFMQLVRMNPELFEIIQDCLDDREVEN